MTQHLQRVACAAPRHSRLAPPRHAARATASQPHMAWRIRMRISASRDTRDTAPIQGSASGTHDPHSALPHFLLGYSCSFYPSPPPNAACTVRARAHRRRHLLCPALGRPRRGRPPAPSPPWARPPRLPAPPPLSSPPPMPPHPSSCGVAHTAAASKIISPESPAPQTPGPSVGGMPYGPLGA